MTEATEAKTLDNQNIAQAHAAIPDLKVFGDGDAWRLICKASSKAQGWMKSTKAMPVPAIGCLVQVTTHQAGGGINNAQAVSEAVVFVPGAVIDMTDPQRPFLRAAGLKRRESPHEVRKELAGTVIVAGKEPEYE